MSSTLTPAGWVVPAIYLPSPNYGQRPLATSIDLLVIHCISLPAGCYGNGVVEQFFTNQLPVKDYPELACLEHTKVSSHFFIRRTGQLVQLVSVYQRAWHAGQSSYNGRSNCNDFAIGVELEGVDDGPFTIEQYDTLIKLTQTLVSHLPGLNFDAIVGHEHIAPGRKTDPGTGFDWQYYRALLAAG